MPRSPARKRPLPRSKAPGYEFGYGKKVTDAVSGVPVPKRLTVQQRGKRVSAAWTDGSRDRPQSY